MHLTVYSDADREHVAWLARTEAGQFAAAEYEIRADITGRPEQREVVQERPRGTIHFDDGSSSFIEPIFVVTDEVDAGVIKAGNRVGGADRQVDDAHGADKPFLVVVTGLGKPFRTELGDADYAHVRALGKEYLSRNPRSIA